MDHRLLEFCRDCSNVDLAFVSVEHARRELRMDDMIRSRERAFILLHLRLPTHWARSLLWIIQITTINYMVNWSYPSSDDGHRAPESDVYEQRQFVPGPSATQLYHLTLMIGQAQSSCTTCLSSPNVSANISHLRNPICRARPGQNTDAGASQVST